MSKTITFEDALAIGRIHQGDYFRTISTEDKKVDLTESETGFRGDYDRTIIGLPEPKIGTDRIQSFLVKKGETKIWRLEEGLKMWGDPTKRILILFGREGIIKGPDALHRVSRELYDFPRAFDQVQSCGLPEKENHFSSPEECRKMLQQMSKKHQHPDDLKRQFKYWLASRVTTYDKDNNDECSCLPDVFWGRLDTSAMYWTFDGSEIGISNPVRPEAIPKLTLLLETEGRDGTRENPYEILNK